MQAKLLRFLEQKEVQRLGTAEADAGRCAGDGGEQCGSGGRGPRRGEFREDLFYRLSAFPLELPTAGRAPRDIVPLAEHFLACMAAAMSSAMPRLER